MCQPYSNLEIRGRRCPCSLVPTHSCAGRHLVNTCIHGDLFSARHAPPVPCAFSRKLVALNKPLPVKKRTPDRAARNPSFVGTLAGCGDSPKEVLGYGRKVIPKRWTLEMEVCMSILPVAVAHSACPPLLLPIPSVPGDARGLCASVPRMPATPASAARVWSRGEDAWVSIFHPTLELEWQPPRVSNVDSFPPRL